MDNKSVGKIENTMKTAYMNAPSASCSSTCFEQVMRHACSNRYVKRAGEINDSLAWKLAAAMSAMALIAIVLYFSGVADVPSGAGQDEFSMLEDFSTVRNLIAEIQETQE
eukprot:TRINITY_DN18797_c0_g1_i1.p5 TRINITY_DN18797_c0_g1~~TRINITY_DN18797_c0_g1_i1.p5  ORF type:complete len:110 (+),score=17.78 TRINITY_DN18797_c0_g1_i1:477-806(+)